MVEIPSGAALRDCGFEVGIGRADDPCARLDRGLAPTRVNARSSIRRSSFTCISIGSSPTSSRNRMPLRTRSTYP